MVSQKVVIKNECGLHLRPAGVLCNLAVLFKSKITFEHEGGSDADAKSILSVLASCVKAGETILLRCEGPDEEEALKTIVDAIEGGLQ